MYLPKAEDEADFSTVKGSPGSSNTFLFPRKCSSVLWDRGLSHCNYMGPFSNDDVATEILSRLPTKSLLAFKCTAKKWNKFISDPSFLRIHHRSSYDILGLFVLQVRSYGENCCPVGPLRFLSFSDDTSRLSLDFLPEKVVLAGSSNGLICCRTFKSPDFPYCVTNKFTKRGCAELVIYVCDPTRKEWLTIRPPEGLCFDDILVFGLASYPFGTSSNPSPCFKLVNVRCSRNDPNMHTFLIYSSDSRKWKMSDAVCSFRSEIREDMVTFANRRLHWLTVDHHILTFDVENELSKLIKLPCCEGKWNMATRLGESEGFIHYIIAFSRELLVWVLENYDEPDWVLKHRLYLPEFFLENPYLFGADLDSLLRSCYNRPVDFPSGFVKAWSYFDEVLILLVFDRVISYSFKTGRVIKHDTTFEEPRKQFRFLPIVVQCHANLISLRNFVGDDDRVMACRKRGRRRATLPCRRPRKNVKRERKVNCVR